MLLETLSPICYLPVRCTVSAWPVRSLETACAKNSVDAMSQTDPSSSTKHSDKTATVGTSLLHPTRTRPQMRNDVFNKTSGTRLRLNSTGYF